MDAYNDGVAETERVKERKRARIERGSGHVPIEPSSEEPVEDRHAVASDEDERQHEENKMRDIYITKRGSETANEEQPEKQRKTVRIGQETPSFPNYACVSRVSCK